MYGIKIITIIIITFIYLLIIIFSSYFMFIVKTNGCHTSLTRGACISEKCNKKWAINYNTDDTNCITAAIIIDKITIMSSAKKAIIVIDKNIVLNATDDGLYVVIIRRNYRIMIRGIQFFSIRCKCNVSDIINYINKLTNDDDILIILSKGRAFEYVKKYKLDKLFNSLMDFGTKDLTKENFNEYTNFIFIGSRKGDINYKVVSNNTVFFPHIELNTQECKYNPMSIYAPKNYLFFTELVDNDEFKTRCGMEANIRGLNKFSIVDDKCIPLTETDYETILLSKNSDQCFNGVGNRFSMNVYKFDKISGLNKVIKTTEKYIDNVIAYEGINQKLLNEGIYTKENNDQILAEITEIYVPNNYFIYITTQKKLMTYQGPIRINNLNNLSIIKLEIRKIKSNSVIFCSSDKVCYILGPGKYTLSPDLFRIIRFVNVRINVDKVLIYNDLGFKDLVEELIGSKIHIVKYPRHVRSIEILAKN